MSAKYRGAWCEGTVRAVNRKLACKVRPTLHACTHSISHSLTRHVQVAFSDKEGGSKTVSQEAIKGTIKINVCVTRVCVCAHALTPATHTLTHTHTG